MNKYILFILSMPLFVVAHPSVSFGGATESNFRALFKAGRPPTQKEANLDWRCFNENDKKTNTEPGEISCGTSYGFAYKNGDFVLPDNLDKPTASLDGKTLVFKGQDPDKNKTFVAVRIVHTAAGPRLIMEESTSFSGWQKPGDKSQVTGFTPHLYSLCVPGNEMKNLLFGSKSNASVKSSASKDKEGDKATSVR